MPTRLCLRPGCPDPATYRGYCVTHARSKEQRTNRAGKAIYGTKRWKLLRNRVLFEEPICRAEGCEELSTDVDHVVSLEQGGEPFSRKNVQGLCKSHHSAKTRQEQLATDR